MFFKKMPFVLLLMIAAIIFFDPFLPLSLKEFFYAISLSLKTLIVFLLPLIIFSLLFKTAITLSNGATKMIAVILGCVCLSNFCSTFLSHYVGSWIYTLDVAMIPPSESTGLHPLWTFTLPKIIDNDIAMFSGIILGLAASRFWKDRALHIASFIEKHVNQGLNALVFAIPLFVIGFVIKMQNDGVMNIILKDYATVFSVIALSQFGYICLCYFILNKCAVAAFLKHLQAMIPAAISGFSTMSSAASMPLTMMGAENNAKDKDLARSVIPATVNIHLVGDCFAIPIFAYAVLKSFGMAEPSLMNYLTFTLYFVLAKFSVAAIPGGGIIVMLPILEKYLGFNGEMMSLITALYILFDPVITSANVLGNGAFAKMIDVIASRGKKNTTINASSL